MKKLVRQLAVVPIVALFAALSGMATADEDAKSAMNNTSENPVQSMFFKAIELTGIEKTLSEKGEYTLFIPTDQAFMAMTEIDLDGDLTEEEENDLREILSYHIVPEKLTSSDLAGKKFESETLSGHTLTINSAGRMTKVGHAALIVPDVDSDMGIIHVIDQVLTPPV